MDTKKKYERFHLRFPVADMDLFREAAKNDQRSFNNWVYRILLEYLSNVPPAKTDKRILDA